MLIFHEIMSASLTITVLLLASASTGCWANTARDMLHYRFKNNDKQHTLDSNSGPGFVKVADEFERILSDADDRYKMAITPKMIKKIRSGSFVELVFAEPQEILIKPIGMTRVKVKKILLGLQDGFGWQKDGSCNIIFGNPDYEEYNIVVTSNPHISEKDLLNILNGL